MQDESYRIQHKCVTGYYLVITGYQMCVVLDGFALLRDR